MAPTASPWALLESSSQRRLLEALIAFRDEGLRFPSRLRNGDTVEIEESPPLSKLKRWVLKRVVVKAKQAGPEIAEVAGTTEQPTKD